VALFGGWLIGAYPGNPSKRSAADECEAIAERQYETTHDHKAAAQPPPTIEQNKFQPPENSGDKADQQMQTERQIAKYNCRLAIYTRDVASFTKWLVYATIGLGAIGVLQGFFLWKSVGLATRAADEARAIMAAQTSADAANAHARAADEANPSIAISL
jgi:hypothetical protein